MAEVVVVVRGIDRYAKKNVSIMVMDNLVIKPLTIMSCVSLFKKLEIKDYNDGMEEKFVLFGASVISPAILFYFGLQIESNPFNTYIYIYLYNNVRK